MKSSISRSAAWLCGFNGTGMPRCVLYWKAESAVVL